MLRIAGTVFSLFTCLALSSAQTPSEKGAADPKKLAERVKEIAGSAEFLRSVPKHFATLKSVRADKSEVTLLIEGEVLPKVWPLAQDAEVKVMGWWGRLSDLILGDRVWVWFKTDRQKQPVAISMIADEISQQDINASPWTVAATKNGLLEVKKKKGDPKIYRVAADLALPGGGTAVFLQSQADRARLVVDGKGLAALREKQKGVLRERWAKAGLPGSVAFVHIFSGEMDLILDHETLRWARSLQPGDKVTLQAEPPIKALVKHVGAWRERTQVRLVVHSLDLADLAVGQRIHLVCTPPSPDLEAAQFPPGLDKPRSRQERIDWFLANIYCTCGVRGDRCTGHFYTLASCNPNACGMPNHMRGVLAEYIDKGLNDRQIFEALLKEHGPDLLKPHLLP